MGFWGRLLKGEPIYQPGDANDPQSSKLPPEGQAVQAETEPNQTEETPVARLRRIECARNGQRLDVYADIKNESRQPILLDKIYMFGAKRELDRRLNPGQSHQFLVYSGPALSHEEHEYVEVQYRSEESGHYFESKHEPRYRHESDGTILVGACLLRGPVHHIH